MCRRLDHLGRDRHLLPLRVQLREHQFPDYPKLGVWPDGYYITYNMFNNGITFAGAKLCALDRTRMLAGAAADASNASSSSTSYGGVLPSDMDGTAASACRHAEPPR